MFVPSELIFWDVPTHKPLTNMLAHQAKMDTIQFFSDGKTVVTSGEDGQVKLWDVASRQAWLTLTNRHGVAVSPNGRTLAVGNGVIELWDVGSRRIMATLPSLGSEVGLYAMAFGSDGKRLATHYENSQVKLWDLETRRDTATFSGHDTFGFSVVFTRDGETMATSSFDSTIRLWRAPRLESKTNP
jgi:WD40 repeat protein